MSFNKSSFIFRFCSGTLVLLMLMPALPAQANTDLAVLDTDTTELPHPKSYSLHEQEGGTIQENTIATDRTVGNGCTYATIADAVAAASSGDRLLLEGGRTFYENLSFTKDLTLQGGYVGCASHSSSATTINGSQTGRVFYILDAVVTLQNLAIRSGSVDGHGAGVYAGSGTQLALNNVEIFYNNATGTGGGLYLSGSSAQIDSVTIQRNEANKGAGVGGATFNHVDPVLTANSNFMIRYNTATGTAGQGGGMYFSNGTLSMNGFSKCFENNAIQGGCAYLVDSNAFWEGSSAEVSYNNASADGGGIFALRSNVYLYADAKVIYNDSGDGEGFGSGGGLYLDDSSLYMRKAEIRDNDTDVNTLSGGGGIYAVNSLVNVDLGSYPCNSGDCNLISWNQVTSTADYGRGGAIYADNSELNLRHLTIMNNQVDSSGGAIYATNNSAVTMQNTLITDNKSTGSTDGLRIYNSSLNADLVTVVYNPFSGTGTGISYGGTSSVVVTRSIIWGHSVNISAGANVTCSDVEGGYTGAGNLNLDPLFAGYAWHDFHLQPNSPLIDRCSGTSPSTDWENDPRPAAFVRPSTPYDMGCDEVVRRSYLPLIMR